MSLAYPQEFREETAEFDPEFGDGWDYEVLCELCEHYHGGEEECLPDAPARPTPCGDLRCCQPPPTPPTTPRGSP